MKCLEILPLKFRHAKSKPKNFELYMVKYILRNIEKENDRIEKLGQIFTQNGMHMGKPTGIKTLQN